MIINIQLYILLELLDDKTISIYSRIVGQGGITQSKINMFILNKNMDLISDPRKWDVDVFKQQQKHGLPSGNRN